MFFGPVWENRFKSLGVFCAGNSPALVPGAAAGARDGRDGESARRVLEEADHRLVIIGAGPAGLAAAVYAARGGMAPGALMRTDAATYAGAVRAAMLDAMPGAGDWHDWDNRRMRDAWYGDAAASKD